MFTSRAPVETSDGFDIINESDYSEDESMFISHDEHIPIYPGKLNIQANSSFADTLDSSSSPTLTKVPSPYTFVDMEEAGELNNDDSIASISPHCSDSDINANDDMVSVSISLDSYPLIEIDFFSVFNPSLGLSKNTVESEVLSLFEPLDLQYTFFQVQPDDTSIISLKRQRTDEYSSSVSSGVIYPICLRTDPSEMTVTLYRQDTNHLDNRARARMLRRRQREAERASASAPKTQLLLPCPPKVELLTWSTIPLLEGPKPKSKKVPSDFFVDGKGSVYFSQSPRHADEYHNAVLQRSKAQPQPQPQSLPKSQPTTVFSMPTEKNLQRPSEKPSKNTAQALFPEFFEAETDPTPVSFAAETDPTPEEAPPAYNNNNDQPSASAQHTPEPQPSPENQKQRESNSFFHGNFEDIKQFFRDQQGEHAAMFEDEAFDFDEQIGLRLGMLMMMIASWASIQVTQRFM